MIESSNGVLFKKLKIELIKNKKSKTVEEILKDSRPIKRDKKTFNFVFEIEFILDQKSYNLKGDGDGLNGDDCLWLPIASNNLECFEGNKIGLKIIPENGKYESLKDASLNLDFFQEEDLDFIPKVYGHELIESEGAKYIVAFIERIKKANIDIVAEDFNRTKKYVPPVDLVWLENNIALSPEVSDVFTGGFYKSELNPEDEWYKKNNFHKDKIIDFQRFRKHSARYRFPTDKTPEEIEEVYQNSLKRYTGIIDSSGLPKWKGTLYQGMRFDNGYEIKGYSSDKEIYDSYRKLPYVPLNKSKGKKVIDIGCNQGFFSFQAAFHGAKEVIGIDIQEEDIATAKDIKQCIKLPSDTKVDFIVGDAVEYINGLTREDNVGLIIANSVMHQIFPNFKGAAKFLHHVSSICPYFVFETPANHKRMNLNLEQLEGVLASHFSVVRCLYVYDAYSTGYRIIFACARDLIGDKLAYKGRKIYPRFKEEAPLGYQNEIRKILSSLQIRV
jgi:SAM-dependent methyltransferase